MTRGQVATMLERLTRKVADTSDDDAEVTAEDFAEAIDEAIAEVRSINAVAAAVAEPVTSSTIVIDNDEDGLEGSEDRYAPSQPDEVATFRQKKLLSMIAFDGHQNSIKLLHKADTPEREEVDSTWTKGIAHAAINTLMAGRGYFHPAVGSLYPNLAKIRKIAASR